MYKIFFQIDPGWNVINALHKTGCISGYTTKLSINRSIVVVVSEYNTVQLREMIRSVYKYNFMISEVKEYSGYLTNDQWEWFKNDPHLITKSAFDNPDVPVGHIVDNNDDNISGINKEESHSLANIDSEFKNIIGLNNVKSDLKKFYNHLKIITERKKRNLKTEHISLHAVFMGPPGTGKTTVARILGKLYKDIGILIKGHVVEVDRGDLVAGYIGHTAKKTKEKLEEAIDGILFIDEAYSLTRGSDTRDFGTEVIETILKFMEDNRNRISIIVAGYEKGMESFINSNPGLKSRFTNYYTFPAYTPSELTKILELYLLNEDYKTTKYILDTYIKDFIKKYKDNSDPSSFGNARSIRNIFDELKIIQSQRITTVHNYQDKDDDFFKKIYLKDVKKLYRKYNFGIPDKNSQS